MPAIYAIRTRHPGSVLVLLTDRHPGRAFVSSWDVLGDTGWIDEVEFYTPEAGVLGKWKNSWRLLRRLRKLSLEHAYLLTSGRAPWQSWRDQLFFRFAIGARHCQEPSAPAVIHGGANASLARLEPEWSRLLGAVPAADPLDFNLPISATSQDEAAVALSGAGLTEGQLLVAFGPGSKMPAKIWPAERYLELGQRLLAAHDEIALVVLGGPEDVSIGNELCAAWGRRSHNLAGSVSVMGAAAALRRCVAYVGNDTGTMHLAAMAGIPCIGLFSARDNPGKWEPYGIGHTLLRRDVDCAGCMLEVCDKNGNKCLRLISVEEVFRAVENSLPTTGKTN